MAYTALYRKWRPSRFDDVKGQDPIVKTLKNQIQAERIGHAYLFCGTRGTGKTSVAKIFAKAVNCENPSDGSPCNECAVCRAISAGSSMNVVEIDAASNNGVDNIREIRDEVKYSPTEGRYRVYIIDEVHMLSAGAFNALLKTLEEPPSYVIFILATTEVHKIPVTVLSRCQRYDFRRIGNDVISERIQKLLEAEQVEAEPEAVRYIAKSADGGMRDALSLLEQCISFYYGEKLTYENVLEVLGAVDTEVFSRLIRLVIQKNVSGCIRMVSELSGQGRDFSQFVNDFIWYMRNLLLVQTSDQAEEAIDISKENLKALKEEANQLEIDTLMRYIRIFSDLSSDMKYASAKRVLLETALIKLMKPSMEMDLESLKQRITDLEQQIESKEALPFVQSGQEENPEVMQRASKSHAKAEFEPEAVGEVIELSPAEYEDYKLLNTEWNQIIEQQENLIKGLLRETRISYEKASGLCIAFSEEFAYTMMNQSERLEHLKEWLEKRYQKQFSIQLKLVKEQTVQPQIVKGSRIPGIEIDIGIED